MSFDSSFSPEQVASWVASLSPSLASKKEAFSSNAIDGQALLNLSAQDLQSKLGLSSLQAKKIIQALEDYKSTHPSNVIKTEASSTEAKNPDATNIVRREHIAFSSTAFGYETRIEGADAQMVSIDLGPAHTVKAEPGSMIYCTAGVDYLTKSDGQGVGRLFTGQRLFLTEWKYHGAPGTRGTVAFAADCISKIIPVDLSQHGNRIICQKRSFLCCSGDIETKIGFVKSFGTGFFGGAGFILQEFQGSGHVFLNASGVVVEKKLRAGERIRVTTGSVVGFDQTIQYQIEATGGLFDVVFGREGLFFTTLTGPGIVWLESHPQDRLAAAVYDRMPKCPSQREADEKLQKAKLIKGVFMGAALLDGATDGQGHW